MQNKKKDTEKDELIKILEAENITLLETIAIYKQVVAAQGETIDDLKQQLLNNH